MSKYTTEVRFICESEAGYLESKGFNDVNDIIEEAAPKIFNFTFPIFDEQYRLPLEIKILRHYYTREICEETVGLWKLRLQDRLNMIMPYYNKLYESELLEFNPFYDVDLTREHTVEHEGSETRTGSGTDSTTGTGTVAKTSVTDTDTRNVIDTDTTHTSETDTTSSGTSTSSTVIDTDTTNANTNTGSSTTSVVDAEDETTTTENSRWDLYSDTPQGGIEGIARATDDLVNNAYLTNARHVMDNGSNVRDFDGTSTTTQSSTITDSGSGTVDTTETGNGTTSETGSIDTSQTGTIDTTQTGSLDSTVTENVTSNNTGSRTSSTSGTTALTSTEDYVEHVTGKQGVISYSKMLQEFRDTFLNIDRKVINDLSDLFFGLWA